MNSEPHTRGSSDLSPESARADRPHIMITDVDDPELTERTFRLGAHGYLVKPFWAGQLLITVKNALRQRELELALKAESWAIEQRSQLLSDMAPVPMYIRDVDRRYVRRWSVIRRSATRYWPTRKASCSSLRLSVSTGDHAS
jgi:DNA-binding response OmpR family regulator